MPIGHNAPPPAQSQQCTAHNEVFLEVLGSQLEAKAFLNPTPPPHLPRGGAEGDVGCGVGGWGGGCC